MLVTLIGNNKMYRIRLPENVEGDYWICDDSSYEKIKLVNIKSYKGNWIVNSNKYSKVIDEKYIRKTEEKYTVIPSNNVVQKAIALKNYSRVFLSVKDQEDIFVLFCAPSYEKSISSYQIMNDNDITIGRDLSNDIVAKDNLINDVHSHIFLKNGNWYIENFDVQFGTFVNCNSISESKELIKNGDIIFICGLKLMLLGNTINIYGPDDKVKISRNSLTKKELKGLKPEIKEDEEQKKDDSIELYEENDYFYRAPRIIDKIEAENVNIDQPPAKSGVGASGANGFLSMFSQMAMSMVTLITLISTLSAVSNGQISGMNLFTRLASAFAMLLSMLLIPIIRIIVTKRQNKKHERIRQVEYKKYINSNIIKINNIMEKQSKILRNNNMSAEQCERIILEKSPELWERRITDGDFLNINVGNGNRPLEIGINKTEPKFSLDHDNLLDIYYDVANKSRILEDVPITTSLAERNIVSIISRDNKKVNEYMENIILQLITLHSYTDLKLVFFVKDENKWDYVKMLPHTWDDARKIRFFANTQNDIKELSSYLEEIMNERSATDDGNMITISRKERNFREFDSYYLIITDNYRNLHNVKIIDRILKTRRKFRV